MTKTQQRFLPIFIEVIDLLNKKNAGTDNRQVKAPAADIDLGTAEGILYHDNKEQS